MNISDLSLDSRIWIYQCNRPFTDLECEEIEAQCQHFISGWAAHGQGLYAACEIKYNRFIVLAVDESKALASGCSIDSSTHFIQSLEKKYGIQLFDRLTIVYREEGKLKDMPLNQFESRLNSGEIKNDVIVFNNLITTVGQLRNNWEVQIENSWHKQLIKAKV